MDNISLKKVAMQSGLTHYTFRGIWSCDNFPKLNEKDGKKKTLTLCTVIKFQIINSAPSNTSGQHWLLLIAININGKNKLFVWDCLGRPIAFYNDFYSRLVKLYGRAPGGFTSIHLPLQNVCSNLCGLCCLYLVHYLVKYPFNVLTLHKNYKLLQTTEIDIVRFFNNKIIGPIFRYNVV